MHYKNTNFCIKNAEVFQLKNRQTCFSLSRELKNAFKNAIFFNFNWLFFRFQNFSKIFQKKINFFSKFFNFLFWKNAFLDKSLHVRYASVVGKKNRTKNDRMKMFLRYLSISTRRFLGKSVFQGGNQTFVVTSTGPSRRSEKENKKRRLQKIEKTFFVACRIK